MLSTVGADNDKAASLSKYRNATIGLAVVLGVVALVAAVALFWMLRKNKTLRRQIEETSAQQAAMQQMRESPSTYRDPYLQDRETDITSVGSPRTHYETYKPPMSPSVPEVDGSEQRYSELDASATANISNMGSPSPGFEHSPRPGMNSPH